MISHTAILFVVNGKNMYGAEKKGANLFITLVIGRTGNSLAVVQSASEESLFWYRCRKSVGRRRPRVGKGLQLYEQKAELFRSEVLTFRSFDKKWKNRYSV
jgi:thiamine monophosphate kinase